MDFYKFQLKVTWHILLQTVVGFMEICLEMKQIYIQIYIAEKMSVFLIPNSEKDQI